jgi:hypothetical protein
MSRSALLVCAMVSISCAGSHVNDDGETGPDGAAHEAGDAPARARTEAGALALDGSAHDAGAFADSTAHATDGGDATLADAAQALRDGGRDSGLSPGTCRQQADCPTDASCRAPDYVAPACRGIACPSDRTPACYRGSDCGTSSRCHVFQDSLCSGGYYRSCGAPCSTDAECMGTRCQSDGTCLPTQHCSLTKNCPTHFHCDALLGSVETGCVRNGCRADAECDGGVCLFEQCHASVGVCHPPVGPCLAP